MAAVDKKGKMFFFMFQLHQLSSIQCGKVAIHQNISLYLITTKPYTPSHNKISAGNHPSLSVNQGPNHLLTLPYHIHNHKDGAYKMCLI